MNTTGIVVAICVGVIGIVTVLAKIFKWGGRREYFEEITDKAIDRIDTSLDVIKDNVNEINSSVAVLNDSVNNIKSSVAVLVSDKNVERSQSPTLLNDFGKSISKEVGGKEWAIDIAKQNVDRLKNHSHTTYKSSLLRMCLISTIPMK